MRTNLLGLFGGSVAAFAAVALFTASAHAQCTKDTDCKADRVCEAGVCRAPDPAVAAPAPAESAPAAAPAADPVAAPPPARRAARDADVTREPAAEPKPKPKLERNSTGMMAAGIVMVSISPIPLIAGLLYSATGAVCRGSDRAIDGSNDRDCSHYGTATIVYTSTALVLIGVGVPLIVIGAKRVPERDPEVAVLPYATPEGAGLRLRLQL